MPTAKRQRTSSRATSSRPPTRSPEQLARAEAKRRLAAMSDLEVRVFLGLVDAPDELSFIRSLSLEDKVSGSLIPFTLWGFQEESIGILNEHDRVFVLKARQLGFTWLVLAHLLYCSQFWGDRLFLIFSQSGDDAIDALHRLRILYNSQDEPPVTMVKNNTEEI